VIIIFLLLNFAANPHLLSISLPLSDLSIHLFISLHLFPSLTSLSPSFPSLTSLCMQMQIRDLKRNRDAALALELRLKSAAARQNQSQAQARGSSSGSSGSYGDTSGSGGRRDAASQPGSAFTDQGRARQVDSRNTVEQELEKLKLAMRNKAR
jgi:hypothetical protein